MTWKVRASDALRGEQVRSECQRVRRAYVNGQPCFEVACHRRGTSANPLHFLPTPFS